MGMIQIQTHLIFVSWKNLHDGNKSWFQVISKAGIKTLRHEAISADIKLLRLLISKWSGLVKSVCVITTTEVTCIRDLQKTSKCGRETTRFVCCNTEQQMIIQFHNILLHLIQAECMYEHSAVMHFWLCVAHQLILEPIF